MRICYVAHSSDHFAFPYVDHFAAAGHDVHLVTLHRDDVPGATTHHLLKRDFDPHRAGLTYLWAHRLVRRALRRIKPDLVHALYLVSNGFMAARAGYHPLVLSVVGSDVYNAIGHPIKRRIIRFALRRADLVAPVSRDLEEQVLSLGVEPEKILQMTEGIDVGRFAGERVPRRSGPARLICTRKLFGVYQCDRIVSALALLAERGVAFELTFAATGPEEPALRRQVKENGLDERVRFLGGYRSEDLPAMLQDSDVYVSASRWDGTSPALLEAMAAGVFPVVSDIQGNRGWVTGEGDGLLFDADRPEALADCLTGAIRDEGLRRDAVEVNRRRVAEAGDRETNMKRLAGYYERLVTTGRARPG